MKRSSSPLVSSVPATITTGGPLAASGLMSARRVDASSSDTTLAALVRAADSILASGCGLRPAGRQRRVRHIDAACRTRPGRRAGAAPSAAAGSAIGVSSWPCRPTPSRRCCNARSAARRCASITRLMRPLTMMATFSDTAQATPMFCSITSTAISPSSARRTSISSTWLTITGARPSVGSSMTSRRGLASSAREIASICCSPPDNCAPPVFLRSARRGNVS